MGYRISKNTVADIMHENDWFSVRGGAKKKYLKLQERKRNLLNQQFNVSRPNEVWVGDVTQFLYNDRKYYICVILDLYARKVVGYRVSPSNSTQLTKEPSKPLTKAETLPICCSIVIRVVIIPLKLM